MEAAVIYNPDATGFNKYLLTETFRNFAEQGMKVKLYESRYSGHVVDLVKKTNETSDLIVSLGGDGTLGEVFLGLGDTTQKARYIHIPTGTANDSADNLGLYKGRPRTSINAYANLDNCISEEVDMVSANNVPFGYVSSCGTFTNLTYETPKSFKKCFGKLGYYLFVALMSFKTLPGIIHKPLNITYEKNGKLITTEALTMIVSNSKTFAGFKLFKDAHITDGLFEVSILKNFPKKRLLSFASELLMHDSKNFDINQYPEYIDTFQTDNFRVSFNSGEPDLGFNHDGDYAYVPLNADNTVEYKISKKVKMILPKRAK